MNTFNNIDELLEFTLNKCANIIYMYNPTDIDNEIHLFIFNKTDDNYILYAIKLLKEHFNTKVIKLEIPRNEELDIDLTDTEIEFLYVNKPSKIKLPKTIKDIHYWSNQRTIHINIIGNNLYYYIDSKLFSHRRFDESEIIRYAEIYIEEDI